MVSTKKRKIYLALTFIGIVIFFISVISFMVLAYITNGNVTQTHVRIAWVLFAFIALGSLMSLIGALLFILLNKEKIKDYLKKISSRITLFGAIFLSILAIVPSVIFSVISNGGTLVNAFSATGLLIVVSVALEFDKSLEAQMLMKSYKGFLK